MIPVVYRHSKHQRDDQHSMCAVCHSLTECAGECGELASKARPSLQHMNSSKNISEDKTQLRPIKTWGLRQTFKNTWLENEFLALVP